MNPEKFTYGFRVAGSPSEPRKLVTWRKAFEKYCAGELSPDEAYLSAWTYNDDLLSHMHEKKGVAGFSGPVWADWLPVDIDGGGADAVADSLERARRLLVWLENNGANLTALSLWFSGGKGFHLFIPNIGLRDAMPGPGFGKQARAFVARIGNESGAGPDLAIYDSVRILRAPNTRHKSGLFKISLSPDEMMNASPDIIRRLAATPRPLDEIPTPGPWCDWRIGGLWNQTSEAITAAPVITPGERTQVNRATLEYIRHGAESGERETRLFQAAANLGEFGCSERLAMALLLEIALDTGLAPSEAKRAITGGIKRGLGAAV